MLRLLLPALIWLPAIAMAADEVTTYTLDNGMDVVVIEDRRAPVVTHMVWYRAGSADEPPGQSGVAHFLEHLLFKATDDLESGELSDIVAAQGGSDNAFTSFDYTAYFQRVAADRLELMMTLEADRMNDIRLTPEDIVTERDVILEERSQRVDSSPGAIAMEQLRATQYLNHRYGVPIIGWRHEMESLSMEDALDFYDLYYSPNNAILIVAGDVDPEEVLELARQHYGPIPAEPQLLERFRSEEPPQLAARRLTYEDPRVAQPYLVRSYLAPERDPGAQEKAAALTYLAELLGGSPFTSALGQALQFDENIAVYTGAGYGGVSLDDTTFSISVAPSDGVDLATAETRMDAVIAEFLRTGPDPDAMERIRTRLRAQEIYARDNVQGLARRYGAALTSGLTVEDVQQWPEILQAVTAEDVLAVAAEVLVPERSVTAYVTAPAPAEEPAEEEVSQ
ncbi:M16 family metallopeptidase [Histidinibacterium lentulum]|uniref:Insulinase family protein n=1 Tax=Histidinibacterium lentulum TaxID=2480588 RepID=A0A3N2R5Y5_9RHOB|nr:pitrilysin family protein [Histidinibacterium lentulum]ROU02844.1 insulinase family protein [Histidinibacterium lentulum]